MTLMTLPQKKISIQTEGTKVLQISRNSVNGRLISYILVYEFNKHCTKTGHRVHHPPFYTNLKIWNLQYAGTEFLICDGIKQNSLALGLLQTAATFSKVCHLYKLFYGTHKLIWICFPWVAEIQLFSHLNSSLLTQQSRNCVKTLHRAI